MPCRVPRRSAERAPISRGAREKRNPSRANIFAREYNIPAVQLIVRIILGRPDIEVVDVKTQEELTSLFGHSVRLDVLARSRDSKRINLEIQRSEEGASPKRARFHLSAVDWHSLPPGEDYGRLPETYIIFITENDIYMALVCRCMRSIGS